MLFLEERSLSEVLIAVFNGSELLRLKIGKTKIYFTNNR